MLFLRCAENSYYRQIKDDGVGENSERKKRDAYKISFDMVERNILVQLGVARRIILKCIIMCLPCTVNNYTGLFKMTVGVLTTCHTQYT